MKSLASLIDESLAELEVMKKSDRFSASEIKLGGPGAGIAGKDPQGSLGKDEEEDDEDEDDEEGEEGEEGEEDKKEDKKPVIGKADGVNDKAEKADGVNDKAEKADDMKKSLEEQSTLLKSYVDNKFAAFESQLDKITKLVSDIADAPVAAKSVSYRGIAPLKKSIAGESESEGEPLTKSVLVEKLFSLKKSGTRVDSADIAGAELANGNELVKIANKYNIK